MNATVELIDAQTAADIMEYIEKYGISYEEAHHIATDFFASCTTEYLLDREIESAAKAQAERDELERQSAEIRAKEVKRQECPCGRCGGRGFLQEYRHVMGGVCFQCEGEGF